MSADWLFPAGLATAFVSCVCLAVAARAPRGVELTPRGEWLLHRRRSRAQKEPLAEAFLMPIVGLLALHVKQAGLGSGRVASLEERLSKADNPWGFLPEEFVAYQWTLALLTFGAFYSLTLLVGSLLPIFALLMAGMSYFVTEFSLNGKVRERRWRIGVKIPYVLDILALTMEAGATFVDAVENIVQRDPDDPFIQELAVLHSEIRMGTSRRDALLRLTRRIDLDWFDSVVSAILQGEELGVPIGQTVKIQADLIRLKRMQRAEKLAEEAPVRMMGPTVLMMVSVLLIFFGPIICRFASGEYKLK